MFVWNRCYSNIPAALWKPRPFLLTTPPGWMGSEYGARIKWCENIPSSMFIPSSDIVDARWRMVLRVGGREQISACAQHRRLHPTAARIAILGARLRAGTVRAAVPGVDWAGDRRRIPSSSGGCRGCGGGVGWRLVSVEVARLPPPYPRRTVMKKQADDLKSQMAGSGMSLCQWSGRLRFAPLLAGPAT